MSHLITVTGMVLFAAAQGEYDKRVVLLTKERGKMSAFARGARKPNSPLAATTEPGTFGTFSIFEGRSSCAIEQVHAENHFAELRMDMEAACYAFYFLEFAEHMTKEENDEREVLKLLYQTMRILTKKTVPPELVRAVFELKLMVVEGVGPQLFQCVSCGEQAERYRFSVRKGGLLCSACEKGVIDGRELLPSTIYTMQFVTVTPVEKLYTFRVSDAVQEELSRVMERYLEVYVGRTFKSQKVLEQMLAK